jgi:SWI/SNF-related matrix-associated actin-dependent regulator of chromatin subfamily A3
MRFHGVQKRSTLDFGRHDIVITTFETLVRQQKKHVDPEYKQDTIFSFSWHRIVLDEGKSTPVFKNFHPLTLTAAHNIRNRATAMAQASCAVHATNRWAITGTPIQNRVTDFGSLLEFLQIYPFSLPKVFDDKITRPWLKSIDRDISPIKKLVKCVSLCRTKAIIDLPRREDTVHHLDFSKEEQEFYDTVKEGTIRKIDDAMEANLMLPGQYLNALQWLNELRLLCNHGLAHAKRNADKSLTITPQETQLWNKSTANKAFETIVCDDEAVCSICRNVLADGGRGASTSEFPKPFLSKCLTLTCGSCVKDSLGGQSTCLHTPVCKSVEVSWPSEHVGRAPIEKPLPIIPPEQVSTKLKTLLNSLQNCPEGEKRYELSRLVIQRANFSSSVVFSYWTYTLDLIESLLRQAEISYARIDGQISGEKREEAIEQFQTDATIQVILVSITCGGAG